MNSLGCDISRQNVVLQVEMKKKHREKLTIGKSMAYLCTCIQSTPDGAGGASGALYRYLTLGGGPHYLGVTSIYLYDQR